MSKELTINGYKLVVSSIPPLAPKSIEMQYRKQNPEPKPPTYTVDAVGGITETFEHTKETIQDEDTDVKEAYLKWEEDHQVWSTELTSKIITLFMTQGIDLKLTKKQETALESQTKMLGLDVPEDESEREVFYLETFVVGSQKAMETLMKEVLAETGIDDEALAVASETFQN